MKLALFVPVAVAGLAALFAAISASLAEPPKSNDYTVRTRKPYVDALAAVQEAAKAEGFNVTAVHHLHESLKKHGFDRTPYTVVEACKPDLAYAVLAAEPRFGSLMPCRIAVYEDGDGATLTTVLPSRLMQLFPARPEVARAAAQVDAAMKRMIDAAAK